jgi:RNA-splicing ligase RtcB
MIEIQGKLTTAKIMIDELDEATYKQIYEFVSHPAFSNPIAIMPDTHAGKGCVIGFTMKMTDKIVPNVIGVDIGCGMLACNIGKILPDTLQNIDNKIRNVVPLGFSVHNNSKEYKEYEILSKKVDCNYTRMCNSIGTLGGGNHFIEIGIDKDNNYWLTIHSGSRNLGKCVCEFHQKKAIDKIEQTRIEYMNKQKELILKRDNKQHIQTLLDKERNNFGIAIRNKTLAYLENEDAKEYIEDMYLCQKYASLNRKTMIDNICKELKIQQGEKIESIHNYINPEDKIIRKGAITSYKGQKMIIPFNMRDGLLICKGKSNPEWNFSAPHGAGRIASRSEAKRNITLEKFKEAMNGIYSTSINKETLDESPFAYKDAEIIEKAIEQTATIITKVKPVLNIKG